MSDIDRGSSPIAGESPLAWVTSAVILAASVVGLVAAVVASFWGSGLGLTVVGLAIVVVVASVGLIVNLGVRRRYLRARRSGDVIVRKPWGGGDLLPPG